MTAKDVIEFFKSCKSSVEACNEALGLAVEALEKQVPQRPIFGYDEQDDIYCPVCKFALGTVEVHEYESTFYNYCPYCSQKLDWSDT